MNKTVASRLSGPGAVKILVAEADSGIGAMMAHLLTDAGCQAEVALDCETALRMAREENFDLIIIDLASPASRGCELCRRLKQNASLRKIPFLFVAGSPDKKDRQRAFALGAVDYILKPFSLVDFVSRILSHTRLKTS
jgi:two-component system phosphate regulon response regulator PhoB